MSYWACSEDFLTTIPIAPVTSFPKSTLMLGEDGEKLHEHFKTEGDSNLPSQETGCNIQPG